MLSFAGGAIGVAIGWLLSVALSRVEFSGFAPHAIISADIIILAVSISIIIGLISGMYPAVRAARLNPIDALHYE